VYFDIEYIQKDGSPFPTSIKSKIKLNDNCKNEKTIMEPVADYIIDNGHFCAESDAG
jgi:hypothetical protein